MNAPSIPLSATRPGHGSPAPSHDRHHRDDIEGLRAIAVLLVVAYHTGAGWASGGFIGVDVFFVISGFLITGGIIREVESSGRLALARFWARRAKRLLPAAALTLAFAAFVTWRYLPLTQREVFGRDITTAALYVVNWEFVARSVDYLAENVGPSPVQHFWSLAIEEQFYILWPLLIAVGITLTTTKRAGRTFVGVAGALVVAASFTWSVLATAASPASSFFSTFTRLWELGIGALIAVGVQHLGRLPQMTYRVLGWGGFVLLALSVASIDASTPWPGWRALLPTMATAMLIVSGLTRERTLPKALLGLRPAVWLGGMSYSLYLWHWPMLVGAWGRWGDFGVPRSALVAVASVVPAWLCHRFVENPVRYSRALVRPRRALSVGLGCTALGVLAGVFVVPARGRDTAPPEELASGPIGAGALRGDATTADEWTLIETSEFIVPDPLDATDDVPVADHCRLGYAATTPAPCEYGDLDSDRTVVLVGDSKAAQWSPAIDSIAAAEGWRLVIQTKSSCPFSAANVLQNGEPYPECRSWNEQVMSMLLDDPPELVITSGVRSLGYPVDGSADDLTVTSMADGYRATWDALADAGIPTVVLIDNTTPEFEVYECVAQYREALSECAFPMAPDEFNSGALSQLAAVEVTDVAVVDPRRWICPDGVSCPAVIGDVLIYRQGSHLTATYVETMTRLLADDFAAATDGLFGASYDR